MQTRGAGRPPARRSTLLGAGSPGRRPAGAAFAPAVARSMLCDASAAPRVGRMTPLSSRIGLRATLVLLTGFTAATVIALGAWLTIRYFDETLMGVAEEATILDIQEIRGV